MKIPKFRNVFIYTVLGFAPLSFSLIFTPFYTQYLSKEAYGLLNLFNAISGLLVPFLGLGIDQALSFMYWDYRDDRKRLNGFMSTTLCLISIVGFFYITFGLLFGRYIVSLTISNAEKYTLWPFILFSLIYPFFVIQSRTFMYYYRNEGEIKKFALLNLSSLAMITAGSILGVIVFKYGAEGAVIGRTFGFCFVVGLFMLFEFRKVGLRFDKVAARLLLKVSMPLFFSSLVGALAYVGDRMIVEHMGTLDLLGIYGFAVTVASVVEILLSSLGNSFIPSIYQVMLKEDEEQYRNLHFSVFVFVSAIIAFILAIIAVSPFFIHLFISPNYFDSIELIPLLCISFMPRCFMQLFTLLFYKHKKTRYILYLNVFYLFSVLISGIAGYYFLGLKGMCVAVCLSALVNMLVAMLYSQRLDPFRYQFSKLYFIGLTTLGSVLLLYLIPYPKAYQDLVYALPFLQFVILLLLICKSEVKEMLTLLTQKLKRAKQPMEPDPHASDE
jgi:O-antigen/teichoic acid export membrane protein